MISSSEFLTELQAKGFSFFSGVPCSELTPIFNECLVSSKTQYIPAQGEGESVSMALGAKLAGAFSVVLSQNTAIGEMLLPIIYAHRCHLGILYVISWKGHPSEKRRWIGDITLDLFRLLEFEISIIDRETTRDELETMLSTAKSNIAEGISHVLLLIPGAMRENSNITLSLAEVLLKKSEDFSPFYRWEAIQWLTSNFQESVFLAPDSFVTRELFELGDREQNLYVLPLGYLSSIALGISLYYQGVITILDGDGSVMMRINTLFNVKKHAPSKYIHVIFDNEGYGTTGNQPLASPFKEFYPFLEKLGFASFSLCFDLPTFKEAYQNCINSQGPHLIIAKVSRENNRKFGKFNKDFSTSARKFEIFIQERMKNVQVSM